MKTLFALLLLLASGYVSASSNCQVQGPDGYVGPVTSALTATCGATVPPPDPASCVPPAVLQGGICVTPAPNNGACSAQQVSDINNLQRNCAYTAYDQVYGTWPGSPTILGKTVVIPSNAVSYIALQFTPNPAHAVKFSSNTTYMGQSVVSISTIPGNFKPGSPGVVCTFNRGASNAPILSSSAWPSVCQLQPGQTYFFNFVLANSAYVPGCTGPGANLCSVSYTGNLVN